MTEDLTTAEKTILRKLAYEMYRMNRDLRAISNGIDSTGSNGFEIIQTATRAASNAAKLIERAAKADAYIEALAALGSDPAKEADYLMDHAGPDFLTYASQNYKL